MTRRLRNLNRVFRLDEGLDICGEIRDNTNILFILM